MTDWEENNNRYLAAALHWLRLSLMRLGEGTAEPVVDSAAMPRSRLGVGVRRTAAVLNGAPPILSADGELTRARAEMDEAARAEPTPALLDLARVFGLSAFEQNILLLCAAMELDTRFAGLCARASDNRPYPTFALALTLFENASWDALSPERPLRYWRMIEINQPAGQPLTTSALRIDERILNTLKGLNYLDDRLSPLLTPIISAGTPGESQTVMVQDIVTRLKTLVATGRLPLVHLLGADSASKQAIAAFTAAQLGLQAYRVAAELLPSNNPGEMETFARLWQRETALAPVTLYIDAFERGEGHGQPALLAHFITRTRSLMMLDTREVWPEITPLALSVEVERPPTLEQRGAWVEALGPLVDAETPALLASQFNLNLSAIQQIAQDAVSRPEADLSHTLWRLCVAHTRPRLDMLAQRIDAKATWDDIVLPDQSLMLLQHIAHQVRQRGRVYGDWGFGRRMNRGMGISVLCSGESGTGKTMAAEVIANDLQLDLYRIDLSAVVSKYIGETEKNLRRLFDAAEDGGAVLFFDEADALFGKRSEVKDSHDRYANIEINYLLQRIEAYRGLALLATNLKSTLDSAFMRRLRFIINFPFPGIPERRLIWQKAFPAEAPTERLNYDHLARLNLSGGNIHNIALNAAFLAAAAGQPINMRMVLDAARIEFLKLERPFSESDFMWEGA